MTKPAFSTTGSASSLAALAVLGRADAAAMAFLLDDELPASQLATLVSHPHVQAIGGQLELSTEEASEILGMLERDNLPFFRFLHERAIIYLTQQLRGGDETAEPVFLAVFERLANRLLADDPERFIELVDLVRDLPLQSATVRQRRRYFEGVALLKRERYMEALDFFDALLAESDLDLHARARSLNGRAVCCRLLGRLEESLIGYEDSLKLWRQLGNEKYEGVVLMNMGIIHYELQNYDDAKGFLSQAEILLQEAGASEWLAVVQNELGLVFRDQGRWSEALTYFDKFATQRRAEDARDHVGLGLNNIGEVLLFQGRLQEATAALQKALEKMTTRVYRVDAHLHLGLTYQAYGKFTDAQAAFQEALDLALIIGRRDILPHVYYRLGDVLRRQGEDTAALAQFEAAAQVIEATREPIQEEGLKISLLGRWQQIYEILVLHCLTLGRIVEAFAWAERARARAFADAVVGNSREGDNVEAGQEGVVTVAEVQATLPAGGALLCYFTTGVLARDVPMLQAISDDNPLREHLLIEPRVILFVITKKEMTVHNCAIDPNAFAMASPRGNPERFLTWPVRQKLHSALLETAGVALFARQLYIIPHGPLHHVPFNALVGQDDKTLSSTAIQELAFAPSTTVLLRHCLAPTRYPFPEQTCLAIGHNAERRGQTLQFTEAEVSTVANLMGGQAWAGSEAKKEPLRETTVNYRWLHFACHGWFNHEQPLESYLETGHNERLTAREVMTTWRLRAQLVTLSACQTGVSRVLRSDEPMGLIRAFLYAGARSVLVTQWPVEDLPTFLLMVRFYRELQEADLSLSQALQLAQQWLRNLTVIEVRKALATQQTAVAEPELIAGLPEDSQPFAHPRYWAAFMLIGGS